MQKHPAQNEIAHSNNSTITNQQAPESYLNIFLIFLRFGFLAWGGPVAQISMIRDELVDKKAWITSDKFKRVLAVYQALPGPEAHELCVYFGMIRRGRIGAILAGLGFMLPGLILMILLSFAYKLYGATVLLPLFIGITPAVSALIIRAAHRIASHILHTTPLQITAAIAAAMTLANIHFLFVFIICGAGQLIWSSIKSPKQMSAQKTSLNYKPIALTFLIAGLTLTLTYTLYTSANIQNPAASNFLFLEGLKGGLLSFGGAYTMLPFLHESMVGTYPAITEQSFLDGIALSNIIPAPLVIFGTYLGFLAGGLSGSLSVTAGIFLPAFSFTLFGHHQLEKLIENPKLHNLLDGISAAVVGILAITAIEILIHSVKTPLQIAIFIPALLSLYFLKGAWTIPVLIAVCGICGYAINIIT